MLLASHLGSEAAVRKLCWIVALGLVAALWPGTAYAALPERVVVRDGRTSPAAVDIAKVVLDASWYWDSTQSVTVRVPHGLRAGQRLTIWYDIDGDASPEGRYDLALKAKKGKPGKLKAKQQLRKVNGWTKSGTRKGLRSCHSEDGLPFYPYKAKTGTKRITVSFDVFGCFGTAPHDIDSNPGAWRVVARMAKGGVSDTAPSGKRWSPAVRGWGPCDPGGGSCS